MAGRAGLVAAMRPGVQRLPLVRALASPAASGGPPRGASGGRTKPANLSGVKHILAVASGKGGVGKSSIAVNLAYLLAGRGAAVGILDADVYGPSLPVLLRLDVKGCYASQAGGIMPIEHEGLRLMSMGYLRPGEHAALRGPLVSAMVQQMLTQTEWGELDYLVVDMPPGTGDIHLTVAQSAQVDAAIVVSTPHKLAIADVEKGISMFNTVSIPTIAVVENMSHFVCGSCGTEHALFDKAGKANSVAEKFGVPNLVQLPFDPELSCYDSGPFVLDPACSDRPMKARLEELADAATRELQALKEASVKRELASVMGTDGRPLLELTLTSASVGEQRLRVGAREVRLACRSATMWDELTGEKRFREEDIPLGVKPTKIKPAGSYAVLIDWTDKHQTLMPYTVLEALCKPAGELP